MRRRDMPMAMGQGASQPDDISGAVTVILPPRRLAKRAAWLSALQDPRRLWSLWPRQPPKATTIALVALVPVLAGVVVASQLRPRGAERVGASVLAYVSPPAQETGSGGPAVDRLALAPPSELSLPAPLAHPMNQAPRCELPVVSVEELPVARAQPPSPFATFGSVPAETVAAVETLPPPKRPAKAPRAKGRRNIDDLVRKVIASDQKY